MNKNIIVGLDMSTLSSGYSIFDGKKLKKYGVWKQDKKILWRDRCINMGNELSNLLDVYSPSFIYCEDTILSGQCGGNVQTVKMLSVLQGIILGVSAVHNTEIKFIMPTTWRSDLGIYTGSREDTKRDMMKLKTIEKVNEIFGLDLFYNIEKPKSLKNQDDIGDAIGIAYSQINPVSTPIKKGMGRKANIK